MGMFSNYNNLKNNYSPTNSCNIDLNKTRYHKPYEDYNELGELIGYI